MIENAREIQDPPGIFRTLSPVRRIYCVKGGRVTKCCRCVSQGQGGDLIAAAAALSVVIAQGKTAEELELLSALFDILADHLALRGLQVSDCHSQAYCSSASPD